MKKHSNGRENATQLEQRLSDEGVIYHAVKGHGFIVVGTEFIFVVEEQSPDSLEGFSFRKIPVEKVQQFHIEEGEPDRYPNKDAKKVSDGGHSSPSTYIQIILRANTVDCYIDADPREVASSFVTFHTSNE